MDLTQVAGVASRVGAAPDARAAERVVLGTRLLMPLLAGSVAPIELVRDLRAAAAGRDMMTLVLPAGGQAAARLEVGSRLFALPPALRDALLAALAQQAAPARAAAAPTAAAPTGATDAARAWAVAAQTTAAAAMVVGGSGAPRAVQRARGDAPAPVVQFAQPLFEPVGAVRAAAAASDRLRHAVERSGLFFESHVAQWASGGRGSAELRAEALRLAAGEPAARVASQVALLQDGLLRLEGLAWPGQPVAITIEREAAEGHDADAASGGEQVFAARLALELPQLGAVAIELRLAGAAVSATVRSAQPQRFEGEVADLGEQLATRGLRPVLLQSLGPEEAR